MPRKAEPPVIAAAKAGFSPASASPIEQAPPLPSQRQAPRERRRRDPLSAVWDSEVVALLKSVAGLWPPAASSRDRRRHPPHAGAAHPHLAGAQRRRAGGHLSAGAPAGPPRAVRFYRLADCGVSIAGTPLDHRLYHFRLAFSGWEHAHIVLGGENFVALADGCKMRVGARSRSRTASQRQPIGRLPQSRCRRATGLDPPLRGGVRALRHGAEWRTRTSAASSTLVHHLHNWAGCSPGEALVADVY